MKIFSLFDWMGNKVLSMFGKFGKGPNLPAVPPVIPQVEPQIKQPKFVNGLAKKEFLQPPELVGVSHPISLITIGVIGSLFLIGMLLVLLGAYFDIYALMFVGCVLLIACIFAIVYSVKTVETNPRTAGVITWASNPIRFGGRYQYFGGTTILPSFLWFGFTPVVLTQTDFEFPLTVITKDHVFLEKAKLWITVRPDLNQIEKLWQAGLMPGIKSLLEAVVTTSAREIVNDMNISVDQEAEEKGEEKKKEKGVFMSDQDIANKIANDIIKAIDNGLGIVILRINIRVDPSVELAKVMQDVVAEGFERKSDIADAKTSMAILGLTQEFMKRNGEDGKPMSTEEFQKLMALASEIRQLRTGGVTTIKGGKGVIVNQDK